MQLQVAFIPCKPFHYVSANCVQFNTVFILAWLGLSAELQVRGGLEEARVAVLLHQGVDFSLGQAEGWLAGILKVLLRDGFGHMVKIYL